MASCATIAGPSKLPASSTGAVSACAKIAASVTLFPASFSPAIRVRIIVFNSDAPLTGASRQWGSAGLPSSISAPPRSDAICVISAGPRKPSPRRANRLGFDRATTPGFHCNRVGRSAHSQYHAMPNRAWPLPARAASGSFRQIKVG